jgi:hypothetical protein
VSTAVPPAARARDAIALALVAAGAGAYLVAWRGMQALAERRVVMQKGEFLMTQWNSYHKLSRLGVAGMVAGALVAAWSFYRLRQPATPALPATGGTSGAAQPDVTPE